MNPLLTRPIEYPESDGNPMAENTLQFQWIVTIKENLEALFARDPNVFVAGDLLWYPVEGCPEIRQAPDAMVVFGRPKGHRGSYMQWVEDGIAPQVVFEVLSPGNRAGEMTRKSKFYERYGVEEYYIYDPVDGDLSIWVRQGDEFQEVVPRDGWVSPRLGIRFDLSEPMTIRNPDGTPFLPIADLFLDRERLVREVKQLATDRKLSNWERDKALAEKTAAEQLAQERAVEIARLQAMLAQRDRP